MGKYIPCSYSCDKDYSRGDWTSEDWNTNQLGSQGGDGLFHPGSRFYWAD